MTALSDMVDKMLGERGIQQFDGPPCAYFELNGMRYEYAAYSYGGSAWVEGGDNRFGRSGDFQTKDDLLQVVAHDMTQYLKDDLPLVWRIRPEESIRSTARSSTLFQAYMRFIQVPDIDTAQRAQALVAPP